MSQTTDDRSRLRSFARDEFSNLDLAEPWSADEVSLLMQRVVVRVEAEVNQLKLQGEIAATAKRDYEIRFSQWMLIAKQDRPELKSDTMREAWIIQDTETGVAQLRFEADRTERLYKDQLTVVRAIQHQGEQLRSMLSRHKHMEEQWNPGRDRGN